MKKFKLALCLLVIFFAITPAANAQEKDIEPKAAELEKMVVTATMTEKKMEEAPGSIEVITSQEIEEMNAQTVAEALEVATGLIVTGETGRIKAPSIRGTGNKHTLVLIDGRRFSMGYKDFLDINQISVDMIDRIEIVRGPTSALYGSDAIGGVVNIITKKPPRDLATGVTYQYGISKYNEGEEHTGRAYVGDSFGRFGFLLAGGSRNKDGWDRDEVLPDDGDHEELRSIDGRFSFNINDDHSLLAGFEYSDMDREGNRFFKNLDRKRSAEDKRHGYFLQYDAKLSPLNNLMLRAYHSEHENEIDFSPTAVVTGEENAKRKLNQVEGRFTGAFLDKHILTVVSEFREESREDETGRDDNLDNLSFYLQDEYQVFDPLYLVLGVRFDEHSEFGSEWTPRASMIYSLFNNLRLKASYSCGFRAPSISELFVTSTRKRGKWIYEPNPDLDPEESKSYELGIEGEYKKFWGRITGFRNEIENLIESVYYKSTGSGPGRKHYYKYQNVAEAEMEGVELESGLNLPLGFAVSGNLTYLKTEDKETGKDLEGQPDYKGYLKLAYHSPEFGLRANIRMDHIGERYYDSGVQDAYTLYHCYLSKELLQRITLFAGVNNIFNKMEEMDNVVYVEPTFYYAGITISY
ncbi:MAG: TonB-dependent receptor [Deltaproteobacteria bacterium]|nr:TonB-dependent receptor [Deltaproteobacteria bacterium]